MNFLSNILVKAGLTVENGTNLATVTGNVGIGTASPSYKNHIVGGGQSIDADGSYLYIRSTSGRDSWGISNTHISSTASDLTILWGDGLTTPTTEYLRVTNSGNVGIGNNSPSRKLDVTGNGRFTSSLIVGSETANTSHILSTGTGSIVWSSSSFGIGSSIPSDTHLIVGRGSYSNMTGFGNTIFGYSPGTSLTTGVNNVLIGNSVGSGLTIGFGNVIVGSSSATNFPSSASRVLHFVNGYLNGDASTIPTSAHVFIGGGGTSGPLQTFYFGQMPFSSSASTVPITFHSPSGSGTNIGGANFTIAAGRGTGTGTPADIIFATSTSTVSGSTLQTLSNRVWIKGDNGRVGIGTNTPSTTLDINGDLTVAGVNNNAQATFQYYSTNFVSNEFGTYLFTKFTPTTVRNNINSRNLWSTVWYDLTSASYTTNATDKRASSIFAQVLLSGNASTKITQPIDIITFDIGSFNTSTPLNMSDIRYINLLQITNGGISGHTIDNVTGIHIPQIKGTSGFTITNGWGVYQEGSSDNNYFNGTVNIGSASIDNSAIFNITSTTKGVLFPRMTSTQKTSIGTPTTGLIVYDSTNAAPSYYNGTSWVNLGSGGVTDGDKGDITVSASGATWTIDSSAVTYSKIQNVAANSFLANATGSSAAVQEISTSRIPLFSSSITGTPSASTFLRGDGSWQSVSGTGTVTTVSVVSANGFAGTVANATTTPAITLTTTITGLLKGNGTAISAAVAGTDYLTATSTIISGSVLFGESGGNINQDNSNLFWDNTNKRLGIGTASPLGLFSVNGGVGQVGFLGGLSSPNRARLFYDTDNTGWKFDVGKLVSGVFTPQMTFLDDGSVGINDTSPDARLKIRGGGSGTTMLNIIENASSTVGAAFLSDGGNNVRFELKRTSDNGIQTQLRPSTDSYINALSGNLGIGTATPNTKLEVAGVARFTGTNGFSIGNDILQNRIQYSSDWTRFSLLTSTDVYAGFSAGRVSIGATYAGSASPTNGMIVEGVVGIATTTVNSSAQLEIVSTSRGVLVPRMTSTQKNAITTPANGLLLYDTTDNELDYYNGTRWVTVGNKTTDVVTNITNGDWSSFNSKRYNLNANQTNINSYGSVNQAIWDLSTNTYNGSETWNAAVILAQCTISGNATTQSTQPFRGFLTGFVGLSGGVAANISDYRNIEVKSPDSSGLTGHVVSGMYGLKINQLSGVTGFTITNGWGVYQEGTSDNNFFAGTVNVGSATIDNTAILNITSTTRGMLIPRMTSTQKTSISAPTNGLMVYDTTNTAPSYYNGSSWVNLGAGGGSGITSLNGLTAGTQTFATGTTGTDFNISSTSSTHTFNIPDASNTAGSRGLIIQGAQTIGGNKIIQGSGATNGTSSLIVRNSSSTTIAQFRDDGFIQVNQTISTVNNRMILTGATNTAGSNPGITLDRPSGQMAAGETMVGIPVGVTATSGSTDITILRSTGTLNTTSTNTSVIRSIYIAHTFTSITGSYRGIDILAPSTVTGGGTITYLQCRTASADIFVVQPTTITIGDAVNFAFNTTTGTKFGTSTSQKIGFYNATPIVQPTTATAAATFVANTGTAVNDSSTFDGYTLGSAIKALRNLGILA